MQLSISSDETFEFSAENHANDGCLLTFKEVTIEEERVVAKFDIVLAEVDCEDLINVLSGWCARMNAARKVKREATTKDEAVRS